jgi:hypothetical protein
MTPVLLRTSLAVILIGSAIRGGCVAGGEPSRKPTSYHCEDPFARSGQPQSVAWWARPSEECGDLGGYVGGGAPHHGSGRYPHEGTWGWDYSGRWLKRKVFLDWSHTRYQGGTGAYRSEPKNHPE